MRICALFFALFTDFAQKISFAENILLVSCIYCIIKRSKKQAKYRVNEQMEKTIDKNNFKHSDKYQCLLIFLCFFIYFTAQLGRYSYTSNINLFIDTLGINKTTAGLVGTLYFLFYGAGQIINGIFCKRYNRRMICLFAVIASSVINVSVFLGVPFSLLFVLWPLNAACQSVLYPSLMLTISDNVEKKYLAASSIVMACATTVGTFGSYGLGALFSLPGNFKNSFLIAALTMTFAGVVWIFGTAKLNKNEKKDAADAGSASGQSTEQPSVPERQSVPTSQAGKLGVLALAELAFFSFISHAVSGGVSTWTPTIIKDVFGLSNGLSAFLSAFIPFFSIFNSILSELAYRWCKTFNNASVLLFGITIILSLGVLAILETNYVVLLSFLIAIRLSSGAAVNLYTAKAPLYLADRCNAGFLSGFLNGLCYLGNAISSFVLGIIADNASWNVVFVVFALMCCLPIVCYFIYLGIVGKHHEKQI